MAVVPKLLVARAKSEVSPAQVTSKHKHYCCPCPKWADLVCSLVLE